LQNPCKPPYLLGGAFLKVSGYLLGLLHRPYSSPNLRSGMIAFD
jgi:hypothetical protein